MDGRCATTSVEIVVYQSDPLATAQANLRTPRRLFRRQAGGGLLVVIFVVLAAATILVAARRWRATLILGLGMAGAMVSCARVRRRWSPRPPGSSDKPAGQGGDRVILEGVSRSAAPGRDVLLVGLVTPPIAVLRRRQWRADLCGRGGRDRRGHPRGAGLSIWSALIGLVVGIALPFVARWLLPAACRAVRRRRPPRRRRCPAARRATTSPPPRRAARPCPRPSADHAAAGVIPR